MAACERPSSAGESPKQGARGPPRDGGEQGRVVRCRRSLGGARGVAWLAPLLMLHSAASGFMRQGQSRPAYLACLAPGSNGLVRDASPARCLKASLNELSAHAGGPKQQRSYSTGSIQKSDTPLMRIPRSPSSFFKMKLQESALNASPNPSPPPGDFSTDNMDHLDGRTEFIAECKLPTEKGTFRLRSYRYKGAKLVVRNGERVLEWTEMEPVVVTHGDLRGKERVLVRVHDQCFTSEVLGSKRCDCKEQLDMAMLHIMQNEGAIIYMPQEGRGIGLANKIAAYELQDGGLDTVDANRHLGFEDDERSYSCVPFILQDMGIRSVQLMTNNPYKITQLRENGVVIDSITPSIVVPNAHNLKYLRTKAERMAHYLSLEKLEAPPTKPATPIGPETLRMAVEALRAGGVAMLLRGEGTHVEAVLVARADLASAEVVSDMSRLTDNFVTAVLPPARWEALALGEGDGTDAPVTVDLLGTSVKPISCQGHAETLRALADDTTSVADLRRPGHVYARRSEGGWGSIFEAALELARMGGGGVACVSQLLSADGVSGPSLLEAMQISESLGVSVARAEDAGSGGSAPLSA